MADNHPWLDFYGSDLQAFWGLLFIPLLFLGYRALRALRDQGPPSPGATPSAAGFVDRYAVVFVILTVVDPFCTGPLTRFLGLGDSSLGSAIAFAFVYLGDFRVFFLLLAVAAASVGQALPLGRAALLSLLVPVVAGLGYAGSEAAWGPLAMGWLWILYESSFLILMLGFSSRWVPRQAQPDDRSTRSFLRFVCLYAAVYYALWLASDLLTLVFGLDVGWALRVIPNQLYYAFFIPVVWFRFFASR